MSKRVIVWFRQDLRIHDNEALFDALDSKAEVIPAFIFDNRTFYNKTSFGFSKTDKYRTKFIIESVITLRKNLEAHGLQLIVRIGKAEEEIFTLAQELKTSWVYCNRERTSEEIFIQDELEKNLWSIGQEVRYSRGKMLYYTGDLPFPVTHTPDTFTTFRKEVEKFTPIRKPIETSFDQVQSITVDIDPGAIPEMSDFSHDNDFVPILYGGEDEALDRLRYYLWDTDLIQNYINTRDQSFGMDFSSKLSAYLSSGCISPKVIYWEVKRYEEERASNESTYHICYELLWRDFFRLMGKKHKEKIFLKGGIKNEPNEELTDNMHLFQIWADGRTGFPFIDANMRQLNATGFMSNRGRQNVASFLINDLKINWKIGAEYFESLLIDYDPCSNYGNWNYLAGVGTDPRGCRYFNTVLQSKKYDPDGKFIKEWCPELTALPTSAIHFPSNLSETELLSHGIVLERDYFKPVIGGEKMMA